MGATVAVVVEIGEMAYLLKIGDARLMKENRRGEIQGVTEDHSAITLLLNNQSVHDANLGVLPALTGATLEQRLAQAGRHAARDLITHSIQAGHAAPSTRELADSFMAIPLQDTHRFVLTSDGVTDVLAYSQEHHLPLLSLAEAFKRHPSGDPAGLATDLIDHTLRVGKTVSMKFHDDGNITWKPIDNLSAVIADVRERQTWRIPYERPVEVGLADGKKLRLFSRADLMKWRYVFPMLDPIPEDGDYFLLSSEGVLMVLPIGEKFPLVRNVSNYALNLQFMTEGDTLRFQVSGYMPHPVRVQAVRDPVSAGSQTWEAWKNQFRIEGTVLNDADAKYQGAWMTQAQATDVFNSLTIHMKTRQAPSSETKSWFTLTPDIGSGALLIFGLSGLILETGGPVLVIALISLLPVAHYARKGFRVLFEKGRAWWSAHSPAHRRHLTELTQSAVAAMAGAANADPDDVLENPYIPQRMSQDPSYVKYRLEFLRQA